MPALHPIARPLAVLFLIFGGMNTAATVAQPLADRTFEEFLTSRFAKTNSDWKLENFCPISTNPVAARVLREYGSMFAASDAVALPIACIYGGESEVKRFQNGLAKGPVDAGGIRVNLQAKAAEALQKSIQEASEIGLSITPYDGAIAASRTYGDSLMLWNGRFFAALDYWTRRGRLTAADRDAVSRLDLQKRIETILNWESQGIFFSTDRTRSIFSSTAPPGSSQHLSMLAFDVAEYSQPEIREILSRNGWYQTVVGDPLHFTFLDVPEGELPSRGLRVVERGSHRYWVPNIATATR